MKNNWSRFVTESNMIEGIHRAPTKMELDEFDRFMKLKHVDREDLVRFVKIYQPNAQLRNREGLNVRVGNHFPPAGGSLIELRLMDLLSDANHHQRNATEAYFIHQRYEHLHPFTDGNGRSGRMLWYWMMQVDEDSLTFLHRWYYQSLDNWRKK